MTALFYVAGSVAVVATLLAITRAGVVHALLYVVVSLLSVAVVFFSLGAPFVGVLEIVVYAGAIMVLFVFVVMLLDQGQPAVARERKRLGPRAFRGPALLGGILAGEIVWEVVRAAPPSRALGVAPREVGRLLFGPWVVGLELAGLLLLAGLVTAYHLGRRERQGRGPEQGAGR